MYMQVIHLSLWHVKTNKGDIITGAFLKVERDGKWENVEVENLTEEELNDIIGVRSNEEIMNWMHLMCSALRLADAAFAKRDKDK